MFLQLLNVIQAVLLNVSAIYKSADNKILRILVIHGTHLHKATKIKMLASRLFPPADRTFQHPHNPNVAPAVESIKDQKQSGTGKCFKAVLSAWALNTTVQDMHA